MALISYMDAICLMGRDRFVLVVQVVVMAIFVGFALLPVVAHAQRSEVIEHQTWLQGSAREGLSWTAMRDSGVVKQQLDYSCGAGAAATLLNSYYGMSFTEQDMLRDYNFDKHSGISIAGLRDILRDKGLTVFALGLDYDTLIQLRAPAIVYLSVRGEGHFSVLKAFSHHGVWLADPAWGNIRLSRSKFMDMWHTRDNRERPGRILVALPLERVGSTDFEQMFFGLQNVKKSTSHADSRKLEHIHRNWSILRVHP